MEYLRYDPSLEQIGDYEVKTFEKIAETFTNAGETVERRDGRAMRVSRAKATALLTGELVVSDGLPAELAQGIACAPNRFETIVRFAQGPGEVLDDDISTHRGVAIKLLNVEGEKIAGDSEAAQDFVLEAKSKIFLNKNANTFLANLRLGVTNAPSLPQGVKSIVSSVARGAESVVEAVGGESKTLDFFRHAPLHPLAESYFSQVPMRWGGFVAKVGLFPTPAMVEDLAQEDVRDASEPNRFRDAMLAHFAKHGAEFELRVQLAIDAHMTPIEDATHEWPERQTPYRTVARLTIPPQNAWSPEREAYFERLSFRPANSTLAHRPLGQVMRARLYVYERLARWRQSENGETPPIRRRLQRFQTSVSERSR